MVTILTYEYYYSGRSPWSNSSWCRCNVLTNATRFANVVTCAAVEIPPSSSLGNPSGSSSLIEQAISRTIRFVSFFEPVAAVASTQASSVGVTIRYRTSSSASASNCIHALRKNTITRTGRRRPTIPNLHRLGRQRITRGPLRNSSKSIHWLITYWIWCWTLCIVVCMYVCMYVQLFPSKKEKKLRKNNNIATMPTRDVLLRQFCKMSLTVGIRGCTLLSLMSSWLYWCGA